MEQYTELQNQFVDLLLVALGTRDAYTREHSARLALMAREISIMLNLSSVEIKKNVLAAKLHDIGKIGISDGILLKPSKLSDEEYTEIKKHPVIGHKMLNDVKIFSHISDYILYHHERWDGNGYPSGLKEKDIPCGARIIGIVDAVDAMLTKRAYKEPFSIDIAINELEKNAGSQFDPYIAELAIKTIKEFKDVFDKK